MPVFSGEDLTKSARLLTTAALVVADPTGVTAGAAGLDAVLHFYDVKSKKHADLKKLEKETARNLKARFKTPTFHCPQGADIHLPQMIVAGLSTPADYIDCNLDAAKIIKRMITRFKEPEHRAPEMIEAYRCLCLPVLRELMDDPRMMAILDPMIKRKMLEQNEALLSKIEKLTSQAGDAAENLGITKGMVVSLARRLATDVEDFDTAYRELERAIEVFADMKRRATLPANTGAQMDAVLKRMAELNEAGDLDAAAAEVDRALETVDAEAGAVAARKAALLDVGVEQDILRRNPASAAARLLAKLEMEVPKRAARFAALRGLWIEWYERGRDKGLKFDAEVAVALAQGSVDLAKGAQERGSGLNDLGISLATLGGREAGTGRLEAAVAAFENALLELTRQAVPLDWALTQNNLGNALATLGGREAGTGRLEAAVAAYENTLLEWTREAVPLDWAATQSNLGEALQALGAREAGTGRLQAAVTACENALLEWTREAVPLDWATTQNNLGNALATLGGREAGTGRLAAAVAAFENALLERTREEVPLDWAATQNNLGAALQTLGGREAGTGRLEAAVAAYENTLLEWTREAVPLDWAITQFNLAGLELAFFDKTGDGARLEAAEGYVADAREVFAAAGASLYLARADAQLANIASRRPA